jgi:hypothetical protein
LIRTIQAQLLRRFGSSIEGSHGLDQWRLFQASANWDAAKAETQLLSSDELSEKAMGLRSHEHLVVDFESQLPAVVEVALREMDAKTRAAECIPLENCFKWHSEPEQLEEGNELRCDCCEKSVRAWTRVDITSFPPILIVQLKRFEHSGAQWQRLSRPVSFSHEGLDLQKVSGGSLDGEPSQSPVPPLYDLLGVCCHVGLATVGHYFALVRSMRDGCWRVMDDAEVQVVLREEVEEHTVEAYVFFYIRRDHRPEAWGHLWTAPCFRCETA